jgi:choline dehydrogenase-like flavoprotein
LPRWRRQDFEELEHQEGISPAWPLNYEDFEPYYAGAERIYLAHGSTGDDPTEPPRSSSFPYPPVPHEQYIQELCDRLRKQGLHPFFLPMGIDLRAGGAVVSGAEPVTAFRAGNMPKGNPIFVLFRPSLEFPNIELLTRAKARRLKTNASGDRITSVEAERN